MIHNLTGYGWINYFLFFTYSFYFAVAAQGPGIVIVRPGRDVKLLCTLGSPSNNQYATAWIIGHRFYGVKALSGGILDGYSVDNNDDNLLVENIVINDRRNGTVYRCVFVVSGTEAIVNVAPTTFLFVTGK